MAGNSPGLGGLGGELRDCNERGRRMQEREFNLLEEPWVKVVTASLEQKEVSLTDALVYAH